MLLKGAFAGMDLSRACGLMVLSRDGHWGYKIMLLVVAQYGPQAAMHESGDLQQVPAEPTALAVVAHHAFCPVRVAAAMPAMRSQARL